MTTGLPIDAADLITKAYGRRRPRYPVTPQTLGLALALLVGQNIDQKRAIWLVHPNVSNALCGPAETFAATITGGELPPAAWRGGALGSLRSLLRESLHEDEAPWPWDTEPNDPVSRLWVDEETVWAEARRRMEGNQRAGAAFDNLLKLARASFGTLAAWGCVHECPYRTRQLREYLVGESQ